MPHLLKITVAAGNENNVGNNPLIEGSHSLIKKCLNDLSRHMKNRKVQFKGNRTQNITPAL